MAFTNENKSASPSFSNENKSDQSTFDQLPLSVIEAETFDGYFRGRLLDDWRFDDIVSTPWTRETKSASPTFTNESKS